MRKIAQTLPLVVIALLMSCLLAACQNANASSTAPSPEAEEEMVEGQTVAREDVEKVLHKASEKTYGNMTFSVKNESTATGTASNGTMQTQTIKTTMTGQLDKSGEKPRIHLSYEARSSAELGITTYEMYIDSSNLVVSQNDQLYVDAMTDAMLNSYASSITSAMTTEEIDAMLDMTTGFKMEEADGETIVSLTIDKDKLAEASASASEESSLPESTQIATMVVSYTVGTDGRFKTMRIMSSTTGSPTYRVHQTYQFSKYDETTMPEWPDLNAYVAQQSGILTDENGRMYIQDENGQIYYVTEIGDDGMIYYDMGTTSSGTSGDDTTYYYDITPTVDTNTSTSTNNTTNNTTEDKGRPYITADDGKIHYLDEEGNRLIENEDGTSYFIDADGNLYFLSYE